MTADVLIAHETDLPHEDGKYFFYCYYYNFNSILLIILEDVLHQDIVQDHLEIIDNNRERGETILIIY